MFFKIIFISFFFQAEDGIRDLYVTGVQTCALPILRAGWGLYYDAFSQDFFAGQLPFNTFNPGPAFNPVGPAPVLFSFRSEERRVGKECRSRGSSVCHKIKYYVAIW